MFSLRQSISEFQAADRRTAPRASGDRRFHRDRRSAERRSNIHPFESRDARLREGN